MALRGGAGISSERHQADENTQEDEPVDQEDKFSLSLQSTSVRDKRRSERENKSKCKEMTEEEMMDLALRLSEQEASVTASRVKQEEEAMMKAIEESMISQTQTFAPSQSLLADDNADVSVRLCSRRRLLYSNGKTTSARNQGDNCPMEAGEANAAEDETNNRNKMQKRKEGGSLPEMPDLLQTQEVHSQASSCSSESVLVPLDSPQSCGSTQMDDCQLCKSPVFPLTGCRARVCVSRLSQDLLETCKTSGFVSFSQDSWTQKSSTVQSKSPTFPKSPTNFPACSVSPAFTDSDQGDDGEQEMSPECGRSPVFGSTGQHEQSPSACKPQVCKNSGFTFSSQESLCSMGRSASCRPKSPVFPGSRSFPNSLPAVETSAISKSPTFSGTEQGQAEQSRGCFTSPVFGRAGTDDPDVMDTSVVPAEPRGSSSDIGPSQSLEEDGKFELLSQSTSDEARVNEASKDCSSAEAELTSDMTLLWSDEDDNDVTPAGSPSPVFPEERPAAVPETTGSGCSSSREVTQKEPCAARPMVHYYWGVPFCPRGLDPDTYTQVIVAQMEVYEKSLKQAQRCLLRKEEWGRPVLPQPENYRSPESPAESPQPHIPQRHGLRRRRKKTHGSADTSPAEEEDTGTDKDNEEEEKNDAGEEDDDTDDCEVCPETQLSEVNSDKDPTVAPEDAQENVTESQPEAELPQAESPAAGPQEVEEEMEVDAPVAIETEGSFPASGNGRNGNLEEEQLEPDVEEVTNQKPQSSASPELEAAAAPQSPEAHIDCPICQGSFPVTEIEVHAAYCDGEVAIVDERRADTLKPRRKRARRAEVADEDLGGCSAAGRNREKCYICLEMVPLRDYSRHTELCIQQQAAKPQAVGPSVSRTGNLLLALEQSESRDSDAGPSRLQPGDVIDLRDDEEDDGVSAFSLGDSPIRSFTPISEAAGCLVDFRKQRSKKPSSSRRRR